MKYEEKTEQFKSYLQQLGYSKSSVYMLPECIKSFLDYHHTYKLHQLTAQHIQQFYEWLHIRPHKRKESALSEAYINHHVYALKLFFNWLEETGQIMYNPISVMKFKSPKSNSREPLAQSEIQQLFAVATLKEKALLHLFYSCGLRRSEGQALNIRDVHFKERLLYVREGKGSRRRAVPLTYKVAQELEQYYLQERTQVQAHHDQEAFMLNIIGQRMRGDSYNKLLKSILEKSGITKEISLHHLRHSIATHLLENGLDIEQVRDFLGHSHLESTQIYTKVNQQQINKL